jgi:hypothetical protein
MIRGRKIGKRGGLDLVSASPIKKLRETAVGDELDVGPRSLAQWLDLPPEEAQNALESGTAATLQMMQGTHNVSWS